MADSISIVMTMKTDIDARMKSIASTTQGWLVCLCVHISFMPGIAMRLDRKTHPTFREW